MITPAHRGHRGPADASDQDTSRTMGDGVSDSADQMSAASAGVDFAPTKRRLAAPAVKGVSRTGTKDADAMKNLSRSTVTQRRAPAEELIAPHEWDAMLNSFEGDTATPPDAPRLPGEYDEELWERLSSTRWLKMPSRKLSGTH